MKGIDFSYDVDVVTLQRGHYLEQWSIPGWGTGNYFADPLSYATRLGINPQGRVLDQFRVARPTRALRSRAASVIDTWTPGGPFRTEGGGIEYFIHERSGLW